MYDLYEIAEILSEIRDTGSTIAKENMLRNGAYVEGFKEILKFIYDPYFTTGLKQKKLDKMIVDECGSFMSPEEFMDYLKLNSTGTDTNAAIANGFIFSYYTEETQWLSKGIATKDLQIGVSVTTLNKVFGADFIPRVGIMRGMLCPDEIKGYYIATEKLDGHRRIIINKTTGVEIYTRSGKRDYGLVEIEEQMKHLPTNYVYDSECLAMGTFANSIELRQATSSIMNRSGIRRGITANIFDMLPLSEYNAGKSKYGATARKAMLAATLGNYSSLDVLTEAGILSHSVARSFELTHIKDGDTPNILAVPILGVVTNKAEALELATPIWERGFEGIMLVAHTSPYEVSPNPRKTLLKIKLVNEYVCRCLAVVEGENKYVGMMGAIIVEYIKDGKAYEVKVGSGFTDYQRQLYWDAPDLITGKMIEIDSFGESKNMQGDYSLNCPIFKRIAKED